LTGFAVLAVAAAAVLITVLRVPPGGARPGRLGRLNHPETQAFERILAGRVLQGATRCTFDLNVRVARFASRGRRAPRAVKRR
jgi:hypothetical protein